MRAFNDALNPEEQIALLTGKVGDGVPGVLGIGRRYFKVEIFKQLQTFYSPRRLED